MFIPAQLQSLYLEKQQFDVQRFTNSCTFNLVQLGQTVDSSQESRFGCLNSRSHFLSHDPTLSAISQNKNTDRSEDEQFCLGAKLPFQYHRSVELGHRCIAFPKRISKWLSFLASLVNEPPRYSNFFYRLLVILRQVGVSHSFGCQYRHMVSVFLKLIFIQTTEHASENLLRACWRPFWIESRSTIS